MSELKYLYKKLIANRDYLWEHDTYKDLYDKVKKIRERIKSGEGLSHNDNDFLNQLVFKKEHNGVCSAGQSILSNADFQLLIQNEIFLSSLEQLILTPNQENFEKLGNVWSSIATTGNPLRVNRVAAACTLEVSSTVKDDSFNTVFDRLAKQGIIIPKDEDKKNWFSKNAFLMKHIYDEFHDELGRGETDEFYLSIFIWQLYAKWDENFRSNIMKDKITELLKWKKQVILQGPPGTGKTYIAKQIARELCESDEPGERWKIIQFHPAYAYEDFVRGIVANTVGEQISYDVENKMLAKFAVKASEDPDNAYILIIDEINRANLPAVLGELIYALEYRDEKVSSIYALEYRDEKVSAVYEYEGKREIVLPKNLHIIGTMNTADRSIGNIDYAIRRRFAFVEMQANPDIIEDEAAKVLFAKVKQLFYKDGGKKSDFISPDFEPGDMMIGHSYFLLDSENSEEPAEQLQKRLEYEIKPILREYVRDGILLDTASDKIEALSV